MSKGLMTCAICGREFALRAEEAYIARDDITRGIVTTVSNSEPKLYDAIDCPHCGCQTILQERKRYASPADIGIEDDPEDDSEDDPDYDLCEGCEHEHLPMDQYPCKVCARYYTDEYKLKTEIQESKESKDGAK